FVLATLDLPVAALSVVAEGKHLVLAGEGLGEELVGVREVVVERAHAEDLLLAKAKLLVPVALALTVVDLLPLFAEAALVPALLDVPVQGDTEFIGVELAGSGCHHARVDVGKVDDLRGVENTC